jgi:hypothetical protein
LFHRRAPAEGWNIYLGSAQRSGFKAVADGNSRDGVVFAGVIVRAMRGCTVCAGGSDRKYQRNIAGRRDSWLPVS